MSNPRTIRANAIPGLVKRGLTLAQMADELGVSENTTRRECWELGVDISTVGRVCARCGTGGRLERFRGEDLCGNCLMTAGDYDPEYEAGQRRAAFEGHQESSIARAAELCYGAPNQSERGNLLKALNRAMKKHGLIRDKKPAGPVKYTDRPLEPFAEVER